MQSDSPTRLGTAITVARAAGVFKRLHKIFDDDVLEDNKARTLRIPSAAQPPSPTTTLPPMHRVSLRFVPIYTGPIALVSHRNTHSARVAPLPTLDPTPKLEPTARPRTEALSRNVELQGSNHALR